MCEVKGCITPNCRRQSHHGRTALATCTHCGDRGELRGNAGHLPAGEHNDWSHALGAGCTRCGMYYVPVDTPPVLLETAASWELDAPGRARVPRREIDMRNSLVERMKKWKRERGYAEGAAA